MTPKPAQFDYRLTRERAEAHPGIRGFMHDAREFFAYISGDGTKLTISLILVLISSIASVATPYIIARALDNYIAFNDVPGLAWVLAGLGALYAITVIAGYIQGRLMGGVSQRTLFRLRTALFDKLQDLPIAFFNQNKAGDLMSRLNNDADKLNQFLSESVIRFVGGFFSIFGIAVVVLVIDWRMGLLMLSVTVVLIVITRVLAPWVERQNAQNLQAIGDLSAALQENLSNFRVIVAYGKRTYFKDHLTRVSKNVFSRALRADSANRVFEPIYDFFGMLALVVVLGAGVYFISIGQLTVGLLVAYAAYTDRFYGPLRVMATIFGDIQKSLAAWSRLRAVLAFTSNITVCEDCYVLETPAGSRIALQDVTFGYLEGRPVIEDVSLSFEAGKTYALVGPTGGGKSTLVSIMSRLYDPLSGSVLLDGKDIRSYTSSERAKSISVILQDPILFSGSVADNIRYGNSELENSTDAQLETMLRAEGFDDVLARFDRGLSTEVTSAAGAGLSLGQKQLISFMRAILRKPRLLILDEATANIDTVTEAILGKTLEALPKETTKVIIAHRLNTIKEADEIMFVNGRHVTRAGSLNDAIGLIEGARRSS